MPLRGKAFVAIWHGIEAGREGEYLAWHTDEHMPERLGIPGFLQGRRYIDWNLAPHPSFTLYEAAHIETFRSPGYLARLNAPTPWSSKVQPTMTDFLRGGCVTLLSAGDGIGGAMAVYRLHMRAGGGGDDAEPDLLAAVLGLGSLAGVTGVHAGRHRPEVTGSPTAETKLRGAAAAPGDAASFDYVVMVEGLAPAGLADAAGTIEARLSGAGASQVTGAAYRLDYALGAAA